jgi:hypothetical protein
MLARDSICGGTHHILALPFAGAKALLLEGDVVTVPTV